ncbi:MAG TPA: zf-HC2 domain-containing protein [Gammaproteobacteria bacterium]|nr:zf-HC2 domain-containing protein [Gammaproteobacteria bacterium]
MTCEETTPLLMDRLQGDISPENEQLLAAHMATCPACRAEVDAMTETWDSLGTLDDEQVPHERLRARFHAGLAAYEVRESRHWTERWFGSFWPQQPALQMGLAAALALIGVFVGQQLPSPGDNEIAQLRSEVRAVGIALLDHQSASERLLGVKWAQGAAQSPEVIDALLERVQYDTNLSVRLAAVDALRADLDNPNVVAGLAAALERQDSPLLQVALADALLAADRPQVEAVRAVLGRTELDPTVREYLQMALGEVDGETPPANEI